jgi:hypothetical protein
MAEAAQVPSLATMNFADDLRAVAQAPDGARWKFETRGKLEVWLTLSPVEHPADQYVAQLLWRDYPGQLPPWVKFVDPATERLDLPKAWPKANGFRPSSLDICANWTAEGFALHPEWASTEHRWRSAGNVILKVARILQNELDTSYTGRFDG